MSASLPCSLSGHAFSPASYWGGRPSPSGWRDLSLTCEPLLVHSHQSLLLLGHLSPVLGHHPHSFPAIDVKGSYFSSTNRWVVSNGKNSNRCSVTRRQNSHSLVMHHTLITSNGLYLQFLLINMLTYAFSHSLTSLTTHSSLNLKCSGCLPGCRWLGSVETKQTRLVHSLGPFEI